MIKDLSAVSGAERITREIAERTAAPMGILKRSLPIAGNINAQIFLVKPLPFGRNILGGKASVDELLLNIIANHDMQALGQFIRFGSDERRLCPVDGKIEIMSGNFFELLREKLLHLRENVFDECLASSDEIFKET